MTDPSFPMSFRLGARALPALVLLFSTTATRAVDTLPLNDADTLAFAQLVRTYDLYIDAVVDMVEAIPATARPSSAMLGKLAHRWRNATVAWMDYVWTDSRGRIVHRTYRALSGPTPGSLLGLGVDVPPLTPNAHAHSVIVVGDVLRTNDAEVKLMHSLEGDILDGSVPRGGRVNLWASQQVCGSCGGLARQFEQVYGTSVTMYEVPRAPKTDPAAAFSRLDAHRRTGFRRLRDGISLRQQGGFGSARPLPAICPP